MRMNIVKLRSNPDRFGVYSDGRILGQFNTPLLFTGTLDACLDFRRDFRWETYRPRFTWTPRVKANPDLSRITV